MTWSALMSEGFLLAATLNSDRHALRGREGLGGPASAAVEHLAEELSALNDTERRQRIQGISQRMARPVEATRVPLSPRALALLAPLAERRLGETWLAHGPAPRPGYRAEAGLRRVLLKIAESGRWQG